MELKFSKINLRDAICNELGKIFKWHVADYRFDP